MQKNPELDIKDIFNIYKDLAKGTLLEEDRSSNFPRENTVGQKDDDQSE